MTATADPRAIAAFWEVARTHIDNAPAAAPIAWAFGATTEHADSLLQLVLDGTKTGTASALWDYEAAGDPLPELGELSIILDGSGAPRAVTRVVDLAITPFDEVTAEHAHAEGEGDQTLDAWREIHERYWRTHSENDRGFALDMPVLCERFEVVYSA